MTNTAKRAKRAFFLLPVEWDHSSVRSLRERARAASEDLDDMYRTAAESYDRTLSAWLDSHPDAAVEDFEEDWDSRLRRAALDHKGRP